MADFAGYSGTPLVRKLGLKSGMRVRLLGAPSHYWELMGEGPASGELDVLPEDSGGKADFTHLFATTPEALRRGFAAARAGMDTAGMVWASWPKKSSGVESRIDRGDVMEAGKAEGLVDIKVCAVDEVWSGLKFVIPLDQRE